VELRIPDAPPGRKPVVVSPFVDEDLLLARGFAVATWHFDWKEAARLASAPAPEAPHEPPPPDASETRVGAWLLASPRPGVIGRAYFQLVGASAELVPTVIDVLEMQSEIDPQRIAIMGSSTFGFVALQALQGDPRLAAGVVRVACGDYLDFLRSSSLALADDPRWLPEGRMELDADYEAELHAHEPIAHADAFPPRPLLLLAGRTDPVMPYACVEHTADAFAEAYTRAGVEDRFRLESFSEEGHHLGEEADAIALRWLERWLEVPPAPR
jgi:predicted esterase